ncbi:MAG TPA: hypothetical protein PKD24_10745 [Pyrinomonadaceae bacterium]|nr:hypothetical protein [Pyrinomonadaceae bacterium]HMP65403.1 hypothetical protein [Pyrinomonadaceae bacterium]
MKKPILAALIVSLAAFAVAGQSSTADYSGVWKLDVDRSDVAQSPGIESMTMTVVHDAGTLSVSTETKRSAGRAGAPGRGGGMGRGGIGAGPAGDGKFTYDLNGSETKTEQATQFGPVPVRLKAAFEKDKLTLSSVRTLSAPMGDVSVTTREEWVLSQDGQRLTVKRVTETPRGTNTMTLVFTRSDQEY